MMKNQLSLSRRICLLAATTEISSYSYTATIHTQSRKSIYAEHELDIGISSYQDGTVRRGKGTPWRVNSSCDKQTCTKGLESSH